MKTYRTITHLHLAPTVQMGDAKIRQAIPVNGLEQVSPFILLHHFDFSKGPGEHNFNVPPHPHRGFSPVTYIFEGSIRHTDSLGNDQVIGKDEVQWINAGRGLIHSERVGDDLKISGGRMQGIQLWINTPRAQKMDAPKYQPLTRDEIPVLTEGESTFRLVSGKYHDSTGPAESGVLTGMLSMKQGSRIEFDFGTNENSAVYVLEGTVKINDDKELRDFTFAAFAPGEGSIKIESSGASKLLVLSGKPINEPVVSHGPFVMTTETEILEAMRDYRDNKMGFLY